MDTAVVITGMGCVSNLGNTVTDFIKGGSYVSHNLAAPETRQSFCKADNFSLNGEINLNSYPRLDVSIRYLLSSVHEALQNAGILPEKISGDSRVGIVIGSCFGLMDSQYKFLDNLFTAGRANSIAFQQTANNLLSGFISFYYHTRGIHFTIYNGWTSGLDALIMGQQLILGGEADIVIAGGVDLLNQFVLEYYNVVLQRGGIFSCNSENFIPGEGAGVVILEKSSEAAKKGRRILGSLICGGQTMFYTKTEFCTGLRVLIGDSPEFKWYYANINKSWLDSLEIKLLKKLKLLDNAIALKTLTGECGGASGVLQLIHAIHRADERCFIFNACLSGHMSYILAEGKE